MNIQINITPKSVLLLLGLIGFISISAVFLNSNMTKEKNNTSNKHSMNEATPEKLIVTMPEVPDDLNFCGERVPLELFDVKERFERELIINVYYQGTNFILMKNATRYFPVIEPILAQYGIPNDFKYLCVAESAMRSTARSSSGAMGLWQFMLPAASQYGLVVNSEIDERMHTEKATVAACKYILDAKNKLGSWTNAAASYNMGMTGLATRQTTQREQDYYKLWLTEETSRYVFRILALKQILERPDIYGFQLQSEETYKPYNGRTITVESSVSSLVQFAKDNGTDYKTLRVLNPWILDTKLTNANKRSLIFRLPD
jgi:membrane-bound lytic murein transglycosylase D